MDDRGRNPALRRRSTTLALLGLAFTLTAGWSPGVQAAPAGAKPRVIEEVIVTARKREESIQSVPVSVTSIGKELQQASLRRLDDVQSFTPNVYIRNTSAIPGGASISIRGVSYQETDKTLDPSIGVVMDGLYLGTASGSLLQNFDIKRVEVLRGPQGTLFGKNTTGGVLNIIRGDVTMDWGGNVRLTMGENGRKDLRAVVNMPLIKDELGVKLFGASINSDGFIRNTTIGDDALGDDKQDYGFATRWHPSDTFDLKFHYEHTKDQTDTGAFADLNQPTDLNCVLQGVLWPVGCAASDPGSDKNHSSTNDRNRNDSDYNTYILTAKWDLPNFTVTSISGLRDMDEAYRVEFDASPAHLLYFDYYNDWKQFSQELRVNSNFSDTFDFVAGLYYWNVEYAQRWNVHELNFALQSIGIPQGNPPVTLTPNSRLYSGQNQRTEDYAAFGSADWHFTDKWTLTAGLRYTYEKKDFKGSDGAYYEAGAPTPKLGFSYFDGNWSETSPKLGLRYQYDPDIMFFGSWTKGFKSGGFFGRQANFNIDPKYDPEYVTNWELGMKSTWLGGRLLFNPTVFLNNYDDKQEEVLIPINLSNVATVVRNASTEQIYGAEAELQMQVTDAWNVRLSYGYLHAKFDNYKADINGDGIVTDNSGLQPRNTPKNTIGVNTSYDVPIGTGELVAFASYRWRDQIEVIANNDPLGHLGSIQNLDLSLDYLWEDGRYQISAYGRNVTDERERVAVRIPPLMSLASWNQGANYGVEFQVRF